MKRRQGSRCERPRGSEGEAQGQRFAVDVWSASERLEAPAACGPGAEKHAGFVFEGSTTRT